jgi:lysozyme
MKSIELIKRHEGLRLTPYKDSEGILTVGYGHNLERTISQETADKLLEDDMNDVYEDCHKFKWYERLNHPRQAVIENMIFNLGINRFSKFKKTINYIEIEQYENAAEEMLRSRWSHQVGNRAVELAEMMHSGDWL